MMSEALELNSGGSEIHLGCLDDVYLGRKLKNAILVISKHQNLTRKSTEISTNVSGGHEQPRCHSPL